MSPESESKTKICPTCGTRLSENATRCLVCGSEFSAKAETKSQSTVQGSRMPELTLSLPAALGLLVLFLSIGAAVVFFALRANTPTGETATTAPDVTVTSTPTVTPTATETPIPQPTPTFTALPPIEYTVATGDFCSTIAAFFNVSIQSIVILNNLPAECPLSVGQRILVPQPTPTPLPQATATLPPAEATRAACDKVVVTVQENDTLSSIADTYAVPQEAIKAYNGLSTDTVFVGSSLTIPLCERAATPGPTPTPTTPPPYPAPNLLLPADGASFTLAQDTITLQWASIGTLRDNEAYKVVVEDVTEAQGRKITEYVTDTKFIVPVTFRPQADIPHIMRWWVVAVRQTGTDDQGQPIWTEAGAVSLPRAFSWLGVANP
ncbi:MAG: LysM peptidoglycan-binding domain-containing protein [Chloroflexota bacterium]